MDTHTYVKNYAIVRYPGTPSQSHLACLGVRSRNVDTINKLGLLYREQVCMYSM